MPLSMNGKNITLLALTLIALAIVNFLFLFSFGSRDIVYDVSFTNKYHNKDILLEGLQKKHILETDGAETALEIEGYVMRQDEIEIAIKAPKNIENFSAVQVESEFRNSDIPTFEVGLRKKTGYILGEPVYEYEYRHLDNKHLNNYKKYLGEEWEHVSDPKTGMILLQREPKEHEYETIDSDSIVLYHSVEDFLNNPPKNNVRRDVEFDDAGVPIVVKRQVPRTATVNVKLHQKYDFPEREKKGFSRFPYTFRGDSSFFVYFDAKSADALEMSYIKQDRNAQEGADYYELHVYDDVDNLVHYQILDDDGITDGSHFINIQKLSSIIPLEKSGGYRIEFVFHGTGNDSFIRNVEINMPRVMLNNFTYVDKNGYLAKNLITKAMVLYGLAGSIYVSPAHNISAQRIVINQHKHDIRHDDQSSNYFHINDPINQIIIPDGDVMVRHMGNPVALNEESLFLVRPSATIDFDIKSPDQEYSFVIADYQFPSETSSGDLGNTQEFSLKGIHQTQDGKILLRLRANGLEGYGAEILLSKLSVTLVR